MLDDKGAFYNGSESGDGDNDDENYNENMEIVDRRLFADQSFFKIRVLKNFANFTGKDLCWSFLLIKWQGQKPATLLKMDSKTGVFL